MKRYQYYCILFLLCMVYTCVCQPKTVSYYSACLMAVYFFGKHVYFTLFHHDEL